MLVRRVAAQRAALLDFLAPSAASSRITVRFAHDEQPLKSSPREPTPKERNALFASLKRVVKDRRYDTKLTNTQVDDFHKNLQAWRNAMLARDLVSVVEILELLKGKRLDGLITPRDWKELSYFVKELLQRTERTHTGDRLLLARLAVAAASANGGGTGEAAFALKALLLEQLRAKDYHGVIDLYNSFVHDARVVQGDAQNRSSTQSPFSTDDDIDQDDLESSTYLKHSPGVFDLHLCALAAYHALGLFKDAVNTVIGVQFRSLNSAIDNFCAVAYTSSELAASFRMFVDHVRIARSISRPKSLSLEIKRMEDQHSSQLLIPLYESIVHACRNSSTWYQSTEEPSAAPTTLPLRLTEHVWAALLNAFGTMRLLIYVQSAWEEMKFQDFQPGTSVWNAFLRAHAVTAGHVNDVLNIWKEMVERRALDCHSYGIMMKAYIDSGLTAEAIRLFEYLRSIQWRTQPGGKSAPEDAQRRIYNTMLDGLLRAKPNDRVDYVLQAESVLQEMKSHGPAPDVFSHNSFLQYYAQHGDVPSVASRLQSMAQEGHTPDTASFTIMLQAQLKANRPNAAQTTLDLARAFGVKPSAALYSTILSAIMGNDGETNVLEALRFLDTMENNGEMRPDERAYSVVLAGLFRQRSLSPERRAQIEEDLQTRIDRSGVNISQLSYNHIVAACLETAATPTPDMIDAGIRYYNEMVRHGGHPNNKALMLVLTTLWREKRDIYAALEVIDTMRTKGIRGDLPLRKLVDKIQRDAQSRVRGSGLFPRF